MLLMRSVFLLVIAIVGSGTGSHDPSFLLWNEDDSPSSISTRAGSGPPIPLWPNNQPIPGERPGVYGKETIKCRDRTPSDHCHDRSITNITIPTLIPFLVKNSDAAMIVAPGGGYSIVCLDKEGTDIAKWLNSIGISAFVLKYRVPDRHWLPFGAAPLMDAQRAMGMVRSMAINKNDNKNSNDMLSLPILPKLNPSKIGFMGFSAGGHLTGHLNVAWAHRTYPTKDGTDATSCRPDYSIMVYPWRSVNQPPVNEPLSGASALNVSNTTPPTMLVQTQDDWAHVENSIYYYLALKNHSVSPSELHVYPQGGHGYGRCTFLLGSTPSSIGRGLPEVCSWPDRAHAFLKTLGVAPTSGIVKPTME